ncbi:hypothetical protein [Clostridium botulinum]|uniref:hypothetical protein n=1 Tax=Clostridium botulinum TaxID=1491 RepID=UPI001E42EA0F|nr:hypothetical protein [Clostridium botulinum]
MENNKIKKPFYKRWWVWVIAIIVIMFIWGGSGSSNKSTNTKSTETALTTQDKELLKKHYKDFNVEQRTQFVKIIDKYNAMNDTDKNEIKIDFERLSKERETENRKWEKKDNEEAVKNKKTEVKEDKNKIPELKRENIIGISNKDFKKLSEQKPREVRNDTTGNWRLTTISDNCDIKDYALSYYNENFENNNQIHAIVNFTTNTTTKISDMGNLIEVIVLQRVEKEEHDAKKLFGGMKLAHYWIYKDNGEIEKIK